MNDWLEWDGGKCPDIEGLRCDIRFRDGTVFEDENSQDWWHDWHWSDRDQQPTDIVAYRVAAA